MGVHVTETHRWVTVSDVCHVVDGIKILVAFVVKEIAALCMCRRQSGVFMESVRESC